MVIDEAAKFNFEKSLRKSNASMFVTFFNMDTREVLLTERLVGRANGIGFRNYWINPVHDVLTQIHDDKHKVWKKEYVN